jgi:hypothetical protein
MKRRVPCKKQVVNNELVSLPEPRAPSGVQCNLLAIAALG